MTGPAITRSVPLTSTVPAILREVDKSFFICRNTIPATVQIMASRADF
jgi:hypothetical protein